MSKFLFWMMVANAIGMLGNLAAYAWASHSPFSLAGGIVNGFVMIFLMQAISFDAQMNAERRSK